MKKKEILDYFVDEIEYPSFKAHNILPYGVLWEYVSSTFLNGFVNYVTPVKIFQIDRYTPESEELKANYVHNLGDDWQEFVGTKSDLRKLVVEGKARFCHTQLGIFRDDIMILAEIEDGEDEGEDRYMFFWYDSDISDCSIGRFETTDKKEEVIQSFVNWLDRLKTEPTGGEAIIRNYTDLPLSFWQGWVSF